MTPASPKLAKSFVMVQLTNFHNSSMSCWDIDEFPQFVNVLLGQMSMVGPRPLVPGELKEHGGKAKDIEKYQSVKPGVTGYWAMRGRSDNDYAERLKLEYFYIDNRSIVLDLKIMLNTFGVVFRQEGAK